jgi:hypothetical protein
MSYGHHSRANFRFDTVLEFEGIITDYEYRNPHTFLTLERTTGIGEVQEWLLAANSISSLKRAGWGTDTFAVGERVTVKGNPDRNADKYLLFLDVVIKQDGSVYPSGKLAPGGRVTESDNTPVGSVDFSGVWQPPFNPRNVATNFQVADLPVTPKGQPFIDTYDQADDPALDCEADSLPMTLLPIYPMQIIRVGDDEVHVWYEQFDGRRIIYLGLDEHPADTMPSHMGHSVGSIENNVLTVDTTHFIESHWGLGRGAPSGLQKHVVERYTLSDNGLRLDVEYTFEDPEYLAEAVMETGSMQLRPEYGMEAWNCDRDSARRHLSLD